MTLQQEWASWKFPTPFETASAPAVGSRAPSTTKLSVPRDGKPTVVAFLRHCGCPFAEKTFKQMKDAASKHPEDSFVAISHSDQAATETWLKAVGGAGNVEVIVDPERDVYKAWGLGVSSVWHLAHPANLLSLVTTGFGEGIWRRPTSSGSRWQTSGTWAVDKDGKVQWGGPAWGAADVPDFEKAVKAL